MEGIRMKRIAGALSLAVLFNLPLVASAQTTPCISCEIARNEAAIQAASNRIFVQTQLQQDLNTRLSTQQMILDNQRMRNALNISNQLDANDWAIRQILLQQQINLLQLEQRAKKPAVKTKH